jgi:uncharacterized membrane protein
MRALALFPLARGLLRAYGREQRVDVSLGVVVVAVTGLAGLVALVVAVRRVAKGRRGRELGDVSGEWLTRQKVRDRRDP